MKRNYGQRFVICLAVGSLLGGAADQLFAASPSQDHFFPGQVVLAGNAQEMPAGYQVSKYYPLADLTVVRVSRGKEREHVKSLRSQGRRAGLNMRYEAFEVSVDDTYYGRQWNFPMVQSGAAWELATGENVSVAVLDTGLRREGSSDGISCVDIRSGSNIINNTDDPLDGNGHGTHVSGTIAQRTDNSTGVAGLAHDACIMPVKVLGDDGGGSTATIAEGLYFAVEKGAKVINMSLGLKAKFTITSDPFVDPALEYAYANGVTVVCASGNDSWQENVSYPAIYPTTIAVGAVGADESIASYSNGGIGLDLVAPGGGDEDSGILQETFSQVSGWGYYGYKGTSMATPHVVSVAALLYAQDDTVTPDMVRTALTGSAKDLGPVGYDRTYGSGLVQAYAALNYSGSCDTDSDGDGWSLCDNDCNDNDAGINPGSSETCADAIDNDCDGVIDEDCLAVCEEKDLDGDGWSQCEGDCDNHNVLIYPGHPDNSRGRWADGLDNDCDGKVDN
ncbi:MAG: S8 family serine peptidase [Proteobacteria bacterium]|nr:S8 family serine peptidase [Pseudomonadota bacterium]MBU1058756.1 S8 family serine peptidase [Pseudomonadota bacterium]